MNTFQVDKKRLLHSKDKSQILFVLIFIGAVLGITSGVVWPEYMQSLDWLGTMFINSLKMIIVPLIFFSIISGLASIPKSNNIGRLGASTLTYYFITTAIAVFLGILAVNLFTPGSHIDNALGFIPDKVTAKQGTASFLDIVTGMVSPNIFWSMSSKTPQIMPIILFSVIIGFILQKLKSEDESSTLVTINLFQTMNKVIIKVVEWIFYLAPVGIFALLASQIAKAGGKDGLYSLIEGVSSYFGTVVLVIFIHALIVLPIIYFIINKKNPFTYMKHMWPALSTAFATASSSATLPVTMKQTERFNISEKSSSVVLPLGATINMDGTALYEAIAAITIAQAYGIDLSVGQQIIIFVTANLAAIGAAGIPQAGLVTMILVLQSVGLPLEGIGIIIAIDWLLDRFRTTLNVWGDAVGASVVDKVTKTQTNEVTT